jgi:hypothetical protein
MSQVRKAKRNPGEFAAKVGKALRRSASTAHKIARLHGTPIYVMENGKVVAKKP